MNDQDRDTLARFERRFAGIEAEVKDPPVLDLGRGTVSGATRTARSFAVAIAVVAVVVAAVALGPTIADDRSTGPGSTVGAVIGSASAGPVATQSAPPTTVPTAAVGDWTARCLGVEKADCIGASERFINLLAWAGPAVFEQSGGALTVEPRPICPPVRDWADGSYCWQVTAERAISSETGEPWCMVIARRSTDTRYPPYVQVGGPDTAQGEQAACRRVGRPATDRRGCPDGRTDPVQKGSASVGTSPVCGLPISSTQRPRVERGGRA